MTGAEHYEEAERLLAGIAKIVNEYEQTIDAARSQRLGQQAAANFRATLPMLDLLVTTAHVHAVLAVAEPVA